MKKSTHHIPKPKAPIGAFKDDKVKIQDGDTGKVSWRKASGGFVKDWDGEPISQNHNRKGLKKRPRHHPKKNKTKHKARMGGAKPSED